MKSSRTGIDAFATYDPESRVCVVLKGTKVSDTISQSPAFRSAKSIEKTRASCVENCIVTKDTSFNSCSSAANFVTGRSKNGFITWRVEDGRTLREYLAASLT